MPSFDVVSRLDHQEIDNAIGNATREITTRYDFKGSDTSIEKKENFKNQFVEESRNELQIAQRELSQSDETMKKLKDSLNRTTITAPVDGVVKNLFFVTEGGVIKPGGSILDLVPTKDSLIVSSD